MVGENFDYTIGDEGRSSDAPPTETGEVSSSSKADFIGVRFRCCGAYGRALPNRDRTAYLANCPKCSKPVRFRVGPGGSDSRFFEVS